MPEQIDKRGIGERIKARRDHLRLTQQEVADQLHINRTTYAHYESGRNEMSASDLPRLGRLFNVPVGYFLGEENEEQMADDEAIRYYRDLTPLFKPAARATLKALYEAQKMTDQAKMDHTLLSSIEGRFLHEENESTEP